MLSQHLLLNFLDLSNGGQAYVGGEVGPVSLRKTLHSLIDSPLVGWANARETARVVAGPKDIVATMRVWEAFAGDRLARKKRILLDKEATKDERCQEAALLYKEKSHFNFLNTLLNHYGSLQLLEDALQSCCISGRTPDTYLQQKLAAHFAGAAEAKSSEALPASQLAASTAPLAASVPSLSSASSSSASVTAERKSKQSFLNLAEVREKRDEFIALFEKAQEKLKGQGVRLKIQPADLTQEEEDLQSITNALTQLSSEKHLGEEEAKEIVRLADYVKVLYEASSLSPV